MNTSPKMHASFYVSDLQKTISFYRRFFGAGPVKVKPGYAKFTLERPALVISFIEDAGRVRPGFGHLGFRVETPEDLATRLAEARAQGLVSLEEKETDCCYAIQDKFWVTDPDGIRWEVYYFHRDSGDEPASGKSTRACCAA